MALVRARGRLLGSRPMRMLHRPPMSRTRDPVSLPRGVAAPGDGGRRGIGPVRRRRPLAFESAIEAMARGRRHERLRPARERPVLSERQRQPRRQMAVFLVKAFEPHGHERRPVQGRHLAHAPGDGDRQGGDRGDRDGLRPKHDSARRARDAGPNGLVPGPGAQADGDGRQALYGRPEEQPVLDGDQPAGDGRRRDRLRRWQVLPEPGHHPRPRRPASSSGR